MSSRKAGKQVLNLAARRRALCREVVGDQIALIGDNAKIVIFPTR